MSRVLVAVPNTGGITTPTVRFLLGLRSRSDVTIELPQGRPVDSNRNSIVRRFLSSDAEHLLMLDSDIRPPLTALDQLLSHRQQVVGGLCWSVMRGKRGTKWESHLIPYPTVMKRSQEGWIVDEEALKKGGLVSCDATGTGCLLVHREVFQKVAPPWFSFQYDSEGVWDVSEDFFFCEKVAAAGYEIFVDTDVECGHLNEVDLKRMNDLLAATRTAK